MADSPTNDRRPQRQRAASPRRGATSRARNRRGSQPIVIAIIGVLVLIANTISLLSGAPLLPGGYSGGYVILGIGLVVIAVFRLERQR